MFLGSRGETDFNQIIAQVCHFTLCEVLWREGTLREGYPVGHGLGGLSLEAFNIGGPIPGQAVSVNIEVTHEN